MNILVSEDIRTVCPEFVGAALEAHITNTPYSAPLWEEIKAFQTDYCRKYTTESIKEMPPIQATRAVYKRCGKDPSRYRPSSEALVRRMLRGLDLYQIDTAVDLINLASIAYGYSIGGFDAGKIVGDTLVLGIGREGEAYEGIGRGPLNTPDCRFTATTRAESVPPRATMNARNSPCPPPTCWHWSTDTTATANKCWPVQSTCRSC